jgi:hypothetical protein
MLAPVARSGTSTQLQKREQRQLASLHRYVGTLVFFRHHPRLARSKVGRREVRRARIWVKVIRGELAETRSALQPRMPWPSWWYAQAMCIHRHEAVDWHEKSNPEDRGGMQFSWSTWAAFGGSGDPADASPSEQLYRAWLLYSSLGRWGTSAGWPQTSVACGLR